MGHFLDPLLDEVKARYSADTQDAHSSGFDQGFEYAELLIMRYVEIVGTKIVDSDHLLEYVRSQPSL